MSPLWSISAWVVDDEMVYDFSSWGNGILISFIVLGLIIVQYSELPRIIQPEALLPMLLVQSVLMVEFFVVQERCSPVRLSMRTAPPPRTPNQMLPRWSSVIPQILFVMKALPGVAAV